MDTSWQRPTYVFSLTEGIEWVFQNTQERDYLIKAADGKVFIYSEKEITAPEPEPIKT